MKNALKTVLILIVWFVAFKMLNGSQIVFNDLYTHATQTYNTLVAISIATCISVLSSIAINSIVK